MADLEPEVGLPVPRQVVVCPDCQSIDVRPSHSSYPRDKETNAAGTGAFWRCRNCGDRFLGPFAPEKKSRRSARGHREDPLSRKVQMTRFAKRWVFPLFVVLVTISAVVYLLNRRNSQPMQQRGGFAPRR